jgi:hypothetical protein
MEPCYNFDENRTTHYATSEKSGTRIRWFRLVAKAIVDRPGWHFVHMFADGVQSVDCSSCDVLATISVLRAQWMKELKS